MGPANNGMARYCKECENEIPAGYDICPTCGALVDGTGNYYDEVDDEEGIGNKRFGFNLRKLKQQRERRSAYQDEDVTDEKARGGRTDDTQLRSAGGDGGTVGVGQWLITLLLLCIPLVNIILIIKWAVDKTTLPSKKICESAARDDCFEYDAIHTVHGHNGQRCGLCAEGLARER